MYYQIVPERGDEIISSIICRDNRIIILRSSRAKHDQTIGGHIKIRIGISEKLKAKTNWESSPGSIIPVA